MNNDLYYLINAVYSAVWADDPPLIIKIEKVNDRQVSVWHARPMYQEMRPYRNIFDAHSLGSLIQRNMLITITETELVEIIKNFKGYDKDKKWSDTQKNAVLKALHIALKEIECN